MSSITKINVGGVEYTLPSGGSGATELNGLSDVAVIYTTGAQGVVHAGQVLMWDATEAKWVNADIADTGALTLDGLTDVVITNTQQDPISDGQVLMWDATAAKWVNADLADSGDLTLDGLTDVVITNTQQDPLISGQALVWDSTAGTSGKWVNSPYYFVRMDQLPRAGVYNAGQPIHLGCVCLGQNSGLIVDSEGVITIALASNGGLVKTNGGIAIADSALGGTVLVTETTTRGGETVEATSIQPRNNTTTGMGVFAVDLQQSREESTQIAAGDYSFAVGKDNTIETNGTYGIAMGYSNSSYYGSISVGSYNKANAWCVAIGTHNNTVGETTPTASSTVSIGHNNFVDSANAFALGSTNVIKGIVVDEENEQRITDWAQHAFAIGQENTIDGTEELSCANATAIGYKNNVSGFSATAIGYANHINNGHYSVALGRGSIIASTYSLAAGDTNEIKEYCDNSSVFGAHNDVGRPGEVSHNVYGFGSHSVFDVPGAVQTNNCTTKFGISGNTGVLGHTFIGPSSFETIFSINYCANVIFRVDVILKKNNNISILRYNAAVYWDKRAWKMMFDYQQEYSPYVEAGIPTLSCLSNRYGTRLNINTSDNFTSMQVGVRYTLIEQESDSNSHGAPPPPSDSGESGSIPWCPVSDSLSDLSGSF